jgi:hypothetical protein
MHASKESCGKTRYADVQIIGDYTNNNSRRGVEPHLIHLQHVDHHHNKNVSHGPCKN